MLKLKWLIYTVLVGLIPVGARLVVYLLAPSAPPNFKWNEADIAAFGLVLNISNINAIEHEQIQPQWKTACNGLSILLVVFLGILFTLSFLRELQPSLISSGRLKQTATILSFTSLMLSYTVYDRLSRLTSRA